MNLDNYRCKRCKKILRLTDEPEYGWCIEHGEQYIGPTPEFVKPPERHPSSKAAGKM